MLERGLTHTTAATVSQTDTALAIGSGDLPVLATPVMTALMENAAMLAVAPFLPTGSTTVGGHIDVRHVNPTPPGARVEARATLDVVEGAKLTFTVVATQGDTVIGEGTHHRFIVDKDRFLAKMSR